MSVGIGGLDYAAIREHLVFAFQSRGCESSFVGVGVDIKVIVIVVSER